MKSEAKWKRNKWALKFKAPVHGPKLKVCLRSNYHKQLNWIYGYLYSLSSEMDACLYKAKSIHSYEPYTYLVWLKLSFCNARKLGLR